MESRREVPSAQRAPLVDRVSAALGAFPLGVYLVLHVVETWPALSGRMAFNARLHTTTAPAWLALKAALVLLPLVVHGALGVRRAGQLLVARVVVGLLALAVWMALLNVASHFAVGRALFGEETPAQPMGDQDPQD